MWLEGRLLKDRYDILFLITENGDAFIAKLGDWVDGKWEWSIGLEKSFSIRESFIPRVT